MWGEFIYASAIALGLIGICSLLHYEIMRGVWALLPKLSIAPRLRILVVIAAIIFAHIATVWIYGGAYWLLLNYDTIGTLIGDSIDSGHYGTDFISCLYFSAVSYTTVGFGDVAPTGSIRMIVGAESLHGLLLIGWSISFTWVAMEKFWQLPHRNFHGKGIRPPSSPPDRPQP